jgi:hypothetical protein
LGAIGRAGGKEDDGDGEDEEIWSGGDGGNGKRHGYDGGILEDADAVADRWARRSCGPVCQWRLARSQVGLWGHLSLTGDGGLTSEFPSGTDYG